MQTKLLLKTGFRYIIIKKRLHAAVCDILIVISFQVKLVEIAKRTNQESNVI